MRGAKLLLLSLVTIAASCATPQASGDAAPPSFVGTWHQFDADCPGAEPVRELILQANGHFSVTWTPFETYQDYWGSWRYDANTHVLTLTVDNGNNIPADLVLSGAVSVDAQHLNLGAISLGSPREGVRCTVPFHR
ncbi:MAG: hypothetical protein HY054_02045 [Proteobacteria bacterium]|nr:hypothetical protein [Pseudomonadota bacterium]